MELIHVKTRNEQRQYLNFIQEVYHDNIYYRDNNSYMLKQLFNGRTSFQKNKLIHPILVKNEGRVVCECLIIYSDYLNDFVQIAFFEALPNQQEAVDMIIQEARAIGISHHAKKIVVGLNGHVNYGLGFLCNHFEQDTAFGTSYNPRYYLDYFETFQADKVQLLSYKWDLRTSSIFQKYEKLFAKVEKNFDFRFLDPLHLKRDAGIYTDLNNECFETHRYYYQRTYQEDYELLKELLLLIEPENLIFAFKDEHPVGFLLWYKNFNELVKPHQKLGLNTILKNKMFGYKVNSAKVAEIAVVEEYRRTGLAATLLKKARDKAQKQGIFYGETSWVLEENSSSNNLCQLMQNQDYKKYVAYEIGV